MRETSSSPNAQENGERRKRKTASVPPISAPHQVMMLERREEGDRTPSLISHADKTPPTQRKTTPSPTTLFFSNRTEFLFSFQDGGWTLVTQRDLITARKEWAGYGTNFGVAILSAHKLTEAKRMN